MQGKSKRFKNKATKNTKGRVIVPKFQQNYKKHKCKKNRVLKQEIQINQ